MLRHKRCNPSNHIVYIPEHTPRGWYSLLIISRYYAATSTTVLFLFSSIAGEVNGAIAHIQFVFVLNQKKKEEKEKKV